MEVIFFVVGMLIGAAICLWAQKCLFGRADNDKAKQVTDNKFAFYEQFNTLNVYAETEIPEEYLEGDAGRATDKIKQELGNAVWPYVQMQACKNHKDFTVTYRSRLTIVDKGHRNPFRSEWNRM